ncbi:carbohydrate ABC transporter membrane protein 1, CUT1 family [Marinococcus luteus]|uniref:Maltose/maltodextrin transport system permease protein n=1 Tax=Marinococcus luteus TaxID=1122204 RepID=A0A1H2V5L9_9BACI|nr:sugar ABC transporter permease [Marinococcus luteus]SDW63621.1 carbohydrate ABC transporter membrane protein 1, CUT1 family [Marinococcus luteus]
MQNERALSHNNKQSRHSVRLAVLLSIIPGAGQWYNRRWIKGTILFLMAAAFIISFFQFISVGLWGLRTLGTIPGLDDSRALIIQGILSLFLIVVGAGFYIFNLVDARQDAVKISEGWILPSVKDAFKNWWDAIFPYALITPGFLLLIFVVVFPLLFMILLAFTNYDRYNAPPGNLLEWVGFENFLNIINVPIWRETFISVLSWTLVWTFVATTLQIILALVLAVFVNDERIKGKKLIRTVFILPWAVPAFVTILIFAALFNDNFGAVNQGIMEPLFGQSVPWLTDPLWSRTALIMIQVWLGFPFVFALFTGVLQSVSKEWYEAADVDGGSKLQKFQFITLPHVLFATAPLLIMQYSFNFNNFNIIYLFNEGGPAVRGQNAGGTDILISWVYELTFQNNMFNMAAAISLIMGLMIAAFAILQFRRTKSFQEEG